MRYLFIFVVSLLISACLHYPPQQYAGIVRIEVDYHEGLITGITATDGKERSSPRFLIASGDATIEFTADEVSAFTGQQARAEIERTLAEFEITPTGGLVDEIVSIIFNLSKKK